jgi:hypothetical protein
MLISDFFRQKKIKITFSKISATALFCSLILGIFLFLPIATKNNNQTLIKVVYAGDFSSIIAAAGSNPITLSLSPGTYDVFSNLTVPANISLQFEQGAIISIADSATLTINGTIEDCAYQCFKHIHLAD